MQNYNFCVCVPDYITLDLLTLNVSEKYNNLFQVKESYSNFATCSSFMTISLPDHLLLPRHISSKREDYPHIQATENNEVYHFPPSILFNRCASRKNTEVVFFY